MRRGLPTMRERLACLVRLALDVPSRAELERASARVEALHGLLMAFAAERIDHADYQSAEPGEHGRAVVRWRESAEHLLAQCRAWFAPRGVVQEAADEVVRRGRAGRSALAALLTPAAGRAVGR